ncbi:MAG: ATP-binding cassette domain-containing protein [Actinobacteria bacterium]|nr:ATP-binding cassette domain-containing protein [Actinomycetota bacterium]
MKIELKGITKRFPGVIANKDVDLIVNGGEVHALLGENGAGKSTLMNVLYGLYEPTEGEVLVNGEPVTFKSPGDAIDSAIGMVHQHFMLVPVFTVTENVMLGVEPTQNFGLLDKRKARARLVELSERFGLKVDPDAMVEDLPVGVEQRVEILKALYRKADCLILDEPTAVLTPAEIDDLFEVIETLKAAGVSIIFISHKLKEVMAVADRITVLRRGEVVGSTTPNETNEQQLAEMMVGRSVQLTVDVEQAQPGEKILEVTDLEVLDDRMHRTVKGVSFEVRSGEILAIAGVQGNGQTELIEGITGMRAVETGTVTLDGKDVTGSSSKRLFEMGMAHVPEDRQEDGLVTSFPIKDNLILNTYQNAPYSKGIVMNRDAIDAGADKLVKEYDVRTPSIEVNAAALSGGNQQKVIVAREFSHSNNLLIASQPTRGLDVGSIQYIHGQIVAKRNEGAAVIIVSSELDEILALGDRIAVMYDGKIIGVLDRSEATRERCGMLMAGLSGEGVVRQSATETSAVAEDERPPPPASSAEEETTS